MQHLLRLTNTVLKIMKMWDQQHYPNVYAVLTHSQWYHHSFINGGAPVFRGVRAYGIPPPPSMALPSRKLFKSKISAI